LPPIFTTKSAGVRSGTAPPALSVAVM